MCRNLCRSWCYFREIFSRGVFYNGYPNTESVSLELFFKGYWTLQSAAPLLARDVSKSAENERVDVDPEPEICLHYRRRGFGPRIFEQPFVSIHAAALLRWHTLRSSVIGRASCIARFAFNWSWNEIFGSVTKYVPSFISRSDSLKLSCICVETPFPDNGTKFQDPGRSPCDQLTRSCICL